MKESLKDFGVDVYPFSLPVAPKLERVFSDCSRSIGLIQKGKSYMSEEKRLKARKKRKKNKRK